jgi:hypothetical protein
MKVIPLNSLSQVAVGADPFIYGSGRLGRVVRRAIESAGMSVSGFVDTSKSGFVDDIRLYSLDEFRKIARADIVLIIASSYFDDILPLVQALPLDACFDARPLMDLVGQVAPAVGDADVGKLVSLLVTCDTVGTRIASEAGLATREPLPTELVELAREVEPALRRLITSFVGPDHLSTFLDKLIEGISEDVANPHLRHGLSGPFNAQQLRHMIFRRLDHMLNFDVMVETGSFRGTTTEWLAGFGRPVYSCELAERYFYYALARVAHYSNVHLSNQDSRLFLSAFCNTNAGKFDIPFFYLDAHWHDDLPLFEEIDIISDSFENYVIMVDDFKNPFHPYDFDSYGPDSELTMECLYPRLRHPDRLCYLFPALPPELETGGKRGTLVAAPRSLCDRLVTETRMLRPFRP